MGNQLEDKDEAAPKYVPEKSETKPQPLSRKLKLLTAAAIFSGNIAYGCAFSTYGPVLTSFQNKYETDDPTISRVLTILTGCYMLGALCGGFIFNYVNRQLAVIVIFGTMSAMSILTPLCPNITLFFLTAAVMGLCCGSYDTAQFVWMMEMMQKECPPYVQGQHFFYAIGPIIASSVMAPFLDSEDEDEIKDEDSKLFIPYTIVGCLNILAMLFHIILFIFLRYRAPPPEMEDSSEAEQSGFEAKLDKKEINIGIGKWSLPWPKLRTVLLCCCFYGANQGMEMCTFQYFPKFGQNSDLHLSESESTYVLTGMNVAFAVGRGIAVFAVFKISVQLILCGNILIVIIANILLLGWAKSSLSTLWAAGILFGFGFSSMMASFSAYIERYLIFTNFIGSLMIVCGSGVASIYPVVVGNFINENVVVLSYTCFFSIVLIIFSFGTSSYLTHRNKTRY